jgi:adenylate kinase family enzyme
MATAVIDEIITDDMSDFEKEKAVYDGLPQSLRQTRAFSPSFHKKR